MSFSEKINLLTKGFSTAILLQISLGLLTGIMGGYLFFHFELPLPWFLGAMSFCVLFSILRLPILSLKRIRPTMSTIMGIMLGSGFSPEILVMVKHWPFTLMALIPYLTITGFMGIWYFHKFRGYDFITAYFCAMPGGLYDMALIGSEFGGDAKKITLVHSARIMLVVFTLSFWFQFIEGVNVVDRSSSFVPFSDLTLMDALILGVCALAGIVSGHVLRLPAPYLLGPMLISGLIHLSGFTEAKLPTLMTNTAQVFLGISLGCRFIGSSVRETLRTLWHSLGFVTLMIMVLLLFSQIFSQLLNVNQQSIMLGFSPAGILEMGLIAVALGADAAFVATHHVFRVTYVITLAPLCFRFWKKRSQAEKLPGD